MTAPAPAGPRVREAENRLARFLGRTPDFDGPREVLEILEDSRRPRDPRAMGSRDGTVRFLVLLAQHYGMDAHDAEAIRRAIMDANETTEEK